MFELHTALVVSLLLGAFMAVGKCLHNPLLFLGSLSASGFYVFLLVHNALLEILKLATLGR